MPAPASAPPAARARAKRESERRKAEGGIRYFAAQPQQVPVLRCAERGCLVLGGNRGGKTVVGAAETVYRLLGRHPYKTVHRAPIKVWACSQDIPGVSDQPHKQLEELRRWLPKDALRGGTWESAYSPMARVLTLANGSVVVFKGYDQGLLKFESDAVHFVWMDEEPDDKRIWSSCLLRLADYDGAWMITATPVLSLQGKGWLEELWERRAVPGCGYATHQLFSYENPHLRNDVLDQLFGNLSEEERQVRAFGAFARLGGRVLSEFDPRVHLCQDFLPPREWRHHLLVDPGWNTAAHLFAAVDPDGDVWLYAEHYVHQQRPDEIVPVLHALWRGFGQPEYACVMDPAGFPPKRTSTGHESPSDADEYHRAAEACGASWLRLNPADNGDPYAWRVKRFLALRRLHVCKSLRWWQWEQERWTREKEREGPAAQERAVPDKPIDRYNHLMDVTRYLCNQLPDPLEGSSPRTRDPYAEYWAGELAGMEVREEVV